MSLIGQTISQATYQAFHNDQIKPIDFSAHRGKWIVLMFYPGDFTFICPTELGEVAELYPEFKKLGAEVFGVSTGYQLVREQCRNRISLSTQRRSAVP